MICSFACTDTDALIHSRARYLAFATSSASRGASKLLQIHAATELISLRIPPSSDLEALKANRKGQHSIRINDQWRICFVWKTDGAHRVEIVDDH
jgi:proteic killer suppression protein